MAGRGRGCAGKRGDASQAWLVNFSSQPPSAAQPRLHRRADGELRQAKVDAPRSPDGMDELTELVPCHGLCSPNWRVGRGRRGSIYGRLEFFHHQIAFTLQPLQVGLGYDPLESLIPLPAESAFTPPRGDVCVSSLWRTTMGEGVFSSWRESSPSLPSHLLLLPRRPY